MTFAKPLWLATALLGAENAACALAVTSQTVQYGSPEGPLGPGAVTGRDRTPFQMTAITTAVGVLLFADTTPLGWLPSDMVDVPSIDWRTVATYPGLRSPETSPVPMGLDVVAPLAAASAPATVPGGAAMVKMTGVDLAQTFAEAQESQAQAGGVRSDPDADEQTRIAGGPGTTEPFAIILIDAADEDYSNLFVSDDAETLRRILDSDHGSGGAFDDVLFAATASLRALPVKDMSHSGWWDDRAAQVIADLGIPADRVYRGSYS